MSLYVNGVGQTGTTLATAEWAASGIVEIGAGKTTSRNRFWKGNIDDVRIQTLVRGSLGAQDLAIGTSAGAATSWQLDENTGTSTSDSAGHLNTATLGSAASWGVAKTGASSIGLTGDNSGNSYVAVRHAVAIQPGPRPERRLLGDLRLLKHGRVHCGPLNLGPPRGRP